MHAVGGEEKIGPRRDLSSRSRDEGREEKGKSFLSAFILGHLLRVHPEGEEGEERRRVRGVTFMLLQKRVGKKKKGGREGDLFSHGSPNFPSGRRRRKSHLRVIEKKEKYLLPLKKRGRPSL